MLYWSKHDVWLGILIFVPMILAVIGTITGTGISFISAFFVAILLLVSWIWLGTRYKIENSKLKVTCGFGYSSYDVHRISKIKESRNFLSASACSLDRLEIVGEGIYTLVSPKDKEGFIASLLEMNESIEVIRS